MTVSFSPNSTDTLEAETGLTERQILNVEWAIPTHKYDEYPIPKPEFGIGDRVWLLDEDFPEWKSEESYLISGIELVVYRSGHTYRFDRQGTLREKPQWYYKLDKYQCYDEYCWFPEHRLEKV